ncbi:uncharacterized protein SPPG_01519 [Spizellomyces punctatus DAOM BR117]|uniref:Uncharacterized protein n=1 Tax=Spizellomyces punctatus (strain DAOM BR117) TaxID=645134 RepID=A0A0L0HSP2_SPIPD|nr:uncharacterized protein SPPG_01519 [Spizellomyces punctatus DAOM BR117]KND04077.1 hypothetical protein SPPG_01519 [Spizellomyces punctatus DAOM BR117]|eukprot:XP_016612116.1 hypothetical protein SPPG_01519 [Spizellomyces punctatus DAOM BR117]
MPQTAIIPPRPTTLGPCTCIWKQVEELRQAELASQAQEEAEKEEQNSSHILNMLPSVLTGGQNNQSNKDTKDTKQETTAPDPATDPAVGLRNSATSGTLAEHLPRRTGGWDENKQEISEEDAKRAQTKTELLKKKGLKLAGRPHPDVLARQIKKRCAKSSENKIGALTSYRGDLMDILENLIPLRHPEDPHSTHLPVIIPIPNTQLCPSCRTYLTYAAYYAPVAKTPYLYEHATTGFMSLIDDATASLETNLPIEPITHHQLYGILRAELSVVEWRIALKLARYQKRTGFLEMFPVRIGEFAEMEIAKKPVTEKPGILKGTANKVLRVVGLKKDFPGPPAGAVADIA